MADHPVSSRAPRWQRRPEARPDEILAAATEVFGELGYRAARLEAIARRAGVSKGTLYLYFDSKDALFREVVRNTIVPLVELGEELVARFEGSTAALFEELVRRMWAELGRPARLRMARVVIGELGHFPDLARFYFEEVVLRGRRIVEAVVERGIARGEMRPEARLAAAHGLPAMLLQTLQARFLFEPFDPAPMASDDLLDGLVDLMLRGILQPDA